MRLTRLSLTNFRAFSRLDMDMPGGIIVLAGDNAQGKTSLLEAVFFLATFTSFQTSQDSQVVNFSARQDEIPVACITAEFMKAEKPHTLELRLILQARPEDGTTPGGRLRKEILLDGIKKPAAHVIGVFNAVIFIPQMMRIIDNGPDERRRYLNMTISQVVPGYADALTKYQQALTRRNALLKQLAEKPGNPDQLDYWDEMLALHGSHLIAARSLAVEDLGKLVQPVHAGLTSQSEVLRIGYQPSLTVPEVQGEPAVSWHRLPGDDLRQLFLKKLHATRRLDLARGVTTTGPHRDDLLFSINGQTLADYGSRGQTRTALQSLKLGEMQWMKARTGETPVLLLDETLAELDEQRRRGLLQSVANQEQAFLTTTDIELFSADFLQHCRLWHIKRGTISQD